MLRRKFEKLKLEYKERPSRFGDVLEEHLPKVYLWSLTRDQPASQVFVGYQKVIPKLDVLLHLDLSVSMAESKDLVLGSAVVILEALKYLTERDIIRLAVVSFGTEYMVNKSLSDPPYAIMLQGDLLGGTAIFETLSNAIKDMRREWRKNSIKLAFIFTDTEDSKEDFENAGRFLGEIRSLVGNIKIILLSLEPCTTTSSKRDC